MKQIFSAIKLTLLCLVLFSIIYPTMISGIAYFSPNNGKGETIEKNGQIVGFQKVGQSFTQDKYFNTRPSAVAYNAAGSGGSNKGPSNPAYLMEIQARIDTVLKHNPTLTKSDIPAEMITASGSGLDPNISPKAASIQVARIAIKRQITIQKIQDLLERHIEKPFFGMPIVNVLELNLALDEL